MDIDDAISLWLDAARALVPGLELFDAHTHLGQNDPDGFKQTPEELTEVLLSAGARGCFVFPMHELAGYREANDTVIAMAQQSGGLMVPFCRVDPADDAVKEAERALALGARGIKLHPRAEQFELDHPEVRRLFALADERSLPVLIHAGRGIPALGTHAVALAGEFPGARLILAHAGVCDLGWIWRAAAELPNLLFDSSWWMTADLLALFKLVPPAQILFASDAPYGNTALSAAFQVRLALQAGLSADQVRLFAGGQSGRIAAGDPPAVAGPAPGEGERAEHLLLDRVAELTQIALYTRLRGGESAELLALARLALNVPDSIDDAPVFSVLRWLFDVFEQASLVADPEDRGPMRLLILAVVVARTPDIPLPAIP
jgi:predicted TIM-barrel fold metal-dependent hydrolase